MQLINTGPEPFFEDVVNHMAAICATPIALVAIERGGRTWACRPTQERGVETNAFGPALFDLLGRECAAISYFDCPDGAWPDGPAPRAYIAQPSVCAAIMSASW